jgi:PIN domain nuclease of toxin-antitoxin system
VSEPQATTDGYLLDTHALHWYDSNPKNLSTQLLNTLTDPNTRVYASSINAWEMRVKNQLGNWPEVSEFLEQYFERLLEYQMRDLAFTSAHALTLERVPMIDRADRPGQLHKDPFDRALIAQALHEKLTLVSSDSNIQAYTAHVPNLQVIW